MIQLNRVLFPTDFTRCAEQAFAFAVHFARVYGAEMHMLHAIVLHDDDPHNPAHHFPDVEELHTLLTEIAGKKMCAAIEDNEVDDLTVRQAQRRGISAGPVILDYASDNEIDLIVMGTHGRRGLGHLLLGSVAEEVVRLAPCPVLTVREQEVPKPVEAIEQILVPIDFSEFSRQTIRYAEEIARSCDAQLQLLHVVEQTVYPSIYRTFSVHLHDLGQHIMETSGEALEELVREIVGPDVSTSVHVIEGNAPSEIVKFAGDHDSDLIVIATHGLTGIEHLLIGSVTEKVVRQAPCPVFTVKPFGKTLV
jgi:nucleotide-binding universal stress UspA family protein